MKISQQSININLSTYTSITRTGNENLTLEAIITSTSPHTIISTTTRDAIRPNVRLLSLKLIIKVFEAMESMDNKVIKLHIGTRPRSYEYLNTILRHISRWDSNRYITKGIETFASCHYRLKYTSRLKKLFPLLSGYTIIIHNGDDIETIKYDAQPTENVCTKQEPKKVLIGISTSLEAWAAYSCINGVTKTYNQNISFYSQNTSEKKSTFLCKLKLLAATHVLKTTEINHNDSIHITSESPYLSGCSRNGYMWMLSKRRKNDEEIKSFLETIDKFTNINFISRKHKINVPITDTPITEIPTIKFPMTPIQTPITIYTDGSCITHKKFGGWAALIQYSNPTKETIIKGHEKDTSNNRMELMAIIEALRHVVDTKGSITIYTDSTYCIHCFNKSNVWGYDYSRINNDLIKALDDAKKNIESLIHIEYVKAHSGIDGNSRVDAIAQLESTKNFI